MYQRCSFVDKLCEILQQWYHCRQISPCIRNVQTLTSCVRHYNSDTIVDTSHHVIEMFKCWQVVWDITTERSLSTHLTMYQRCPNVDQLCETLQLKDHCQHISPCIRNVQMLTSFVRHYNWKITVNTSHHVSEMFKCWLVVWDITTVIPFSTHLTMY